MVIPCLQSIVFVVRFKLKFKYHSNSTWKSFNLKSNFTATLLKYSKLQLSFEQHLENCNLQFTFTASPNSFYTIPCTCTLTFVLFLHNQNFSYFKSTFIPKSNFLKVICFHFSHKVTHYSLILQSDIWFKKLCSIILIL